jgi:hypothetical protein
MLMQCNHVKSNADMHIFMHARIYVAAHTYIDRCVFVTCAWSHYSVLHSCKTRDTFVPQLSVCVQTPLYYYVRGRGNVHVSGSA